MNCILIKENKIYCANIGDSRAVIGRKVGDRRFRAIPLSIDHKPSIPLEHQRIIS